MKIGLKCHMNDIQAALGLVQLGKLDAMNQRRREIVAAYFQQLRDIPGVELPVPDDEDHRSSWHIFHIKCDARNQLSQYLHPKGLPPACTTSQFHLY